MYEAQGEDGDVSAAQAGSARLCDADSTKPDAGPCSSQVVTCHDLLLLGGPARAEEKYPFETEPIVMHCGAVPFISKNCKQEGGGRRDSGAGTEVTRSWRRILAAGSRGSEAARPVNALTGL